MTIKFTTDSLRSGAIQKPVRGQADGTGNPGTAANPFSSVLDAEMNRETSANATQQVNNPKQLCMDAVAPMQLQPTSVPDPTQMVSHIENLLNTLEIFQQKLGDPNVPLQDLQGIVGELNQQQAQLAPSLDAMDEENGLKDLLNQTLVTTSMAVTRYENGAFSG